MDHIGSTMICIIKSNMEPQNPKYWLPESLAFGVPNIETDCWNLFNASTQSRGNFTSAVLRQNGLHAAGQKVDMFVVSNFQPNFIDICKFISQFQMYSIYPRLLCLLEIFLQHQKNHTCRASAWHCRKVLMAMPKETHMSIQIGFSAQTKCSQTQERARGPSQCALGVKNKWWQPWDSKHRWEIGPIIITSRSNNSTSNWKFTHKYVLWCTMMIHDASVGLLGFNWDSTAGCDMLRLDLSPGFDRCKIGTSTERCLWSSHGWEPCPDCPAMSSFRRHEEWQRHIHLPYILLNNQKSKQKYTINIYTYENER